VTRPPIYAVAVRRRAAVSARLLWITLGGAELAGFASTWLADERVTILIPRPVQSMPVLPSVDERDFTHPPGAMEPIVRTLTLRRFDPVELEIDVEVVLHDDGPVAAWARSARGGETVGVAGPAGGYRPSPDADCYLLAGDSAALPAICTIAERLPAALQQGCLRSALGDLEHDRLVGRQRDHSPGIIGDALA